MKKQTDENALIEKKVRTELIKYFVEEIDQINDLLKIRNTLSCDSMGLNHAASINIDVQKIRKARICIENIVLKQMQVISGQIIEFFGVENGSEIK